MTSVWRASLTPLCTGSTFMDPRRRAFSLSLKDKRLLLPSAIATFHASSPHMMSDVVRTSRLTALPHLHLGQFEVWTQALAPGASTHIHRHMSEESITVLEVCGFKRFFLAMSLFCLRGRAVGVFTHTRTDDNMLA